MNRHSFILFSILILTLGSLSSCVSLQAPTFQSVEKVEVAKSTLKEITITGNVLMNNPNQKAIDLKEMQIKMLSNGNDLGTFMQEVSTSIEAKSDFTIPFAISFDPKQMGESLLSTVLSAMSDQKLKLSFRGFVKVQGKDKKRGFKIPIIYSQSLKL